MNISIVIILCLLFVVIVWAFVIYNRFITIRNRFNNARSHIDVQLKRRYELIPGFVDLVKRFCLHEKSLLESIARARISAMATQDLFQKPGVERKLSGVLHTLSAISEGYPELQANANFLELQDELSKTENNIRFARQFYNDTVMRYNTLLETFPNILLAKLFRFDAEKYFNMDEGK